MRPGKLKISIVIAIAAVMALGLSMGCDDGGSSVTINQEDPDAGEISDADENTERQRTTVEADGIELTAYQPYFDEVDWDLEVLVVPLKLANKSVVDPVSASWQLFRIVTEDLLVLAPHGTSETEMNPRCRGDVEIDPGGNFECAVAFEIGGGEIPTKIRYTGLDDVDVEVELLEALDGPPPCESIEQCSCEFVHDECEEQFWHEVYHYADAAECEVDFVDDFVSVNSDTECESSYLEELALQVLECHTTELTCSDITLGASHYCTQPVFELMDEC